MKVINQTRNTSLGENISLADNLFSRMKGLLGKGELASGEGLIIKPCDSIHTFFMRFSIDVIFVNKNNTVIKTISSMKPFRLSGIYFNSVFAIELPPGTIQDTRTEAGDLLQVLP